MFGKRGKSTVSTQIMTTSGSRPFVPGMGIDWLLPFYDPFTKLLGLQDARRELLRQADLQPGQRVMDIGCGTGSLVILTKRLFPRIEVIGLDPDPKALARARRKAQRSRVEVSFDRGFSDELQYPDASFDRVFSSFMFHHLERGEKERTLREIRRVLMPGGSLHLLDFGGPDAGRHGRHLPGIHSHHRLADNDKRTVLEFLSASGLTSPEKIAERGALKVIRLVYYRARRSQA
jgi:ubiquinone/menaquinone biosynthesis C-methylase UbiE